jgi:hypothetical protein
MEAAIIRQGSSVPALAVELADGIGIHVRAPGF